VLAVPSLQPLPPAPGLAVRPTLVGVGLAELRALVEQRGPVDVHRDGSAA
jgi:hypothetical protein